MPLFYHPELPAQHLSPEESRHAIKVLRLNRGDQIELTDGKGHFYQASITQADERKTEISMGQPTAVSKKTYSIHLAVAPTKNIDRMEWLVEKCTEVGVDKISFVVCKTSERNAIPLDRLKKIAISAMKQSRQAWLPPLNEPIAFSKFLQDRTEVQRFIALVDESNPLHLNSLAKPNGDYVILVGPEGDFVAEELELAMKNGFQKVSLGPSRLRTETAGIYCVMALSLVNQIR